MLEGAPLLTSRENRGKSMVPCLNSPKTQVVKKGRQSCCCLFPFNAKAPAKTLVSRLYL
jgi:hypothetical protein